MSSQQDYYEILGVSKNATADELKRAYRQQALKWHPDRHQGEEKKTAEAKFKEINQAYEVLSNPEKRRMYDQVGHTTFTQQSATGGFGGQNPFAGGFRQGPFTYTYSTNVNAEDLFGGFSDPFEIFEQFFGGGNPFGGRTRARKPLYSVELSFMDAVKGVMREVSIEGRKKTIKIPAGVDDNTRVRFTDFDIVVKVAEHDTFKRQGQDVVIDQPISFTTAVLGGTVHVPTVEGDIEVKIRAGTKSGTVLRLRGRGIPYPNRSVRGDEYVRVTIAVPTSLSRKQKELLHEFEKNNR